MNTDVAEPQRIYKPLLCLYAKPLQHVKENCYTASASLECCAMAKKKNPAAVALGKLGGKKSAKGRMEKMTPEQRKLVAQNAAKARWSKKKT